MIQHDMTPLMPSNTTCKRNHTNFLCLSLCVLCLIVVSVFNVQTVIDELTQLLLTHLFITSTTPPIVMEDTEETEDTEDMEDTKKC